ncbi:D-alanyl-D-alanine carboxypeptidase, partial [Parageobacillus sp. SY1]
PVTEEEIKELHVKIYLLRPKKDWKKDERGIPTVVGKAVLYLGDQAVDEVPLLYKKGVSKETNHSIWNAFHFLGVGSDG